MVLRWEHEDTLQALPEALELELVEEAWFPNDWLEHPLSCECIPCTSRTPIYTHPFSREEQDL